TQVRASGGRLEGADGGADKERGARGKQRVEEEAVVALEVKLEGNVVGGRPAKITELAAQPGVERERGGSAAGDQDEGFTRERASELPAIGAECLANGHLAIAGGAAREQEAGHVGTCDQCEDHCDREQQQEENEHPVLVAFLAEIEAAERADRRWFLGKAG